jgi:hypothetical protein
MDWNTGLCSVDVDGVKYCYEGYHQNNLTTKIHTEALNYCIGKYLLLIMLHGLTELENQHTV